MNGLKLKMGAIDVTIAPVQGNMTCGQCKVPLVSEIIIEYPGYDGSCDFLCPACAIKEVEKLQAGALEVLQALRMNAPTAEQWVNRNTCPHPLPVCAPQNYPKK